MELWEGSYNPRKFHAKLKQGDFALKKTHRAKTDACGEQVRWNWRAWFGKRSYKSPTGIWNWSHQPNVVIPLGIEKSFTVVQEKRCSHDRDVHNKCFPPVQPTKIGRKGLSHHLRISTNCIFLVGPAFEGPIRASHVRQICLRLFHQLSYLVVGSEPLNWKPKWWDLKLVALDWGQLSKKNVKLF